MVFGCTRLCNSFQGQGTKTVQKGLTYDGEGEKGRKEASLFSRNFPFTFFLSPLRISFSFSAAFGVQSLEYFSSSLRQTRVALRWLSGRSTTNVFALVKRLTNPLETRKQDSGPAKVIPSTSNHNPCHRDRQINIYVTSWKGYLLSTQEPLEKPTTKTKPKSHE